MDEIKLRILLQVLGIIAAVLSITKTIFDIFEKLEAKRKAHIRRKPPKHKRK